MFKNPFVHAIGASAYITLVVSVIHFISQTQGDKPDAPFAPIVFLSLLTLSVAIMSYLFFYQPVQLFIEGKKKHAVNFFVQTVGIFGAITAILVIVLMFSSVLFK